MLRVGRREALGGQDDEGAFVLDRLDADAGAALVADLTAALSGHTDDEGVIFPFETIVVTADR